MSECKGCGSPIINCGAPIWEYLCSNKDCTYDSDHFRIQMNAAFAEVKRQQRLQDAAPDLYEALELICNTLGDGGDVHPDSPIGRGLAALSKARGEHK